MTTKQPVRTRFSDVLDILIFGGLVIFLLLLPFHLVIKKLVPDPVGTYWKEFLLALLVVLWAVDSLLARRRLRSPRALDGAVLIYLGLLLLRFVVDGSWWVGAWGLYASILYLPLFWLVPTALRRRPARLRPLLALLVGVGSLVALGGLVEFALDVPLWPSEEMVQRNGFPDVFIYGTNIRRVYFTFDSPTTLANTLALLLPLALALFLTSRRILARLAAGVAVALMAACMVVTFSRGIWVATALSLAVMGVWIFRAWASRSDVVRRAWRPLLVVGGTLALIALAWAGAWLAWHPWEESTYRGVLELSSAAYDAAPVTQVRQELLLADPLQGQVISQTWTLRDPIAAQDDTRPVLYQHPPEGGKVEIIYAVEVPEEGALRFAIALSPEVWSPDQGDGASFEVYVAEPNPSQAGQPVFVRYINPKLNPTDRRWRNFLVDLSPWARRTVHVSLVTDVGPAGDWTFDWAGWADPQVVSVEPGTFASAQTEDAIVRHTRSILDWARDETNRDRLAAWSQGLTAWLGAPLWGTGLGSTGVAALRTRPEQAFVTESQVLKALVELGPLGLLVLAYLWFQIARAGYRTYRATDDRAHRILLIGLLISLLAIFVEGWVYQNLEVKQVNAYFWALVGVVAFLAGQVSRPGGADQPAQEPAGIPPGNEGTASRA